MESSDSSSELHRRKLQEHVTQRLDSTNLLGVLWQTNSARLQVAKRNFDPKYIEAMTQYLRSQSTLLELVAIQLSQQLIRIYGQELDQKITSEVILIHIKNSVKEIFEQNNIWQEVSKEIWSNLISRSIQDMQRDLGELVLESLDLAGFNDVLFQYLFDQESTLFISRINHLEAFYAQTIAAEIIQDPDLNNRSQSALNKLLGIRSNNLEHSFISQDTPAQIEQIVTSSAKSISEGVPQQAPTSISTQLQADLQQPGAEGIAYARYHAKNSQDNTLEHYIASSGDLETLPWESIEQIINKLGLDAAKLHFLLAAHAVRQVHPWESAFTLKASDIITELGWDKNGFDLPTKYNQVADTTYALANLLLKVAWVEAEAENQTDSSTLVGRVWEALIHPYGQLDWKTGKIEKPEDVYITIRPGLGTIYFLNQANSQARKTLYQFGNLAGNLLQLDPYDNGLALRLMIHLTLDARTRASDPNPYEYQVESILAAVLPEDTIQHLREGNENARVLFDSWSHALDLLSRLGWYSEGNSLPPSAEADQTPVFYVKPYPRWLEPESSFRKPRGWVEYWLEQRLIIKSPIPEPEWITALVHSSQPQEQTLRRICSSNLSGAEVRAARQAKKLTQTELAGLLQVHQSLIARIESGDRTITPTLEASLRQILELECNE